MKNKKTFSLINNLSKPNSQDPVDVTANEFCDVIVSIRENRVELSNPKALAQFLSISEDDLYYWSQHGHPNRRVWESLSEIYDKIQEESNSVEEFIKANTQKLLKAEDNFKNFKFSSDCRSIYYLGELVCQLSPKKASVVEFLLEQYRSGKKYISKEVLISWLYSDSSELASGWRLEKSIFSTEDMLWGNLIKRENGQYYLDFSWNPQYTEQKLINDKTIFRGFSKRKNKKKSIPLHKPTACVDKMEFIVTAQYASIPEIYKKEVVIQPFEGPIPKTDLRVSFKSEYASVGKAVHINGMDVLKHLNPRFQQGSIGKWSNAIFPEDLKTLKNSQVDEVVLSVSDAILNLRENLEDLCIKRKVNELHLNPVKVRVLEFCRDYPKQWDQEDVLASLKKTIDYHLGKNCSFTKYEDGGMQYKWECKDVSKVSSEVAVKLYDKTLYWRVEIRKRYKSKEFNIAQDLNQFIMEEKAKAEELLDNIHNTLSSDLPNVTHEDILLRVSQVLPQSEGKEKYALFANEIVEYGVYDLSKLRANGQDVLEQRDLALLKQKGVLKPVPFKKVKPKGQAAIYHYVYKKSS